MNKILYWSLLPLLMLLFVRTSVSADNSSKQLETIIGHKFHINTDHKYTLYDFPTKEKLHIITADQDMTIIELVNSKYGLFYKIALSKERYHYYVDSLEVYAQIDQDYVNKIKEEQRLLRLRQEEEAKREEAERLRQEDYKRLDKMNIETNLEIMEANLKPNYKGHDFQKLFIKYFDTLIGKNEFEKTADYKNKLKAINLSKIYAFQLSDNENVHINYDSDNEMFEVTIESISATEIMPKNGNISSFIVLKTTNKKSSNYVGTNAFGAKITIKKYEARKYGVQVVKNEASSYSISFQMPLKEAKKQKANLAALMVCKPYIEDDTLAFMGGYYAEPTFSDPIELNYSIAGINVELLEIWLYDLKTGKVLHKRTYWE